MILVKNIFEKANLIFALIFLVILIYSFFYYYQYGDDFIFLNLLKEKNVFEAIIYKYKNWDGRHLSIGGLLQMVGFEYLGPFFTLIVGLIAVFLFFFISLKSFKIEINTSSLFPSFVLFLIGLLPFYKDVLFWQTGIIYVYFLLQAIFIIFFYLRDDLLKNKLLLYFFVFVLGFNSQNFNVALLVFIWSYDFLSGKSIFPDKKRIVFSGLIILSTLLVSVAPGNFIRIEKGTESELAWSNLIEIGGVYLKAFNYCKYFLICGILGGTLFFTISKSFPKKEFISLVLAGLTSLTPFILYPDLARIRVFFSMGAFLFLSGLILGSYFSKYRIALFSKVLVGVTILFGIKIMFNQSLLLRTHSFQINERHNYLLENSNEKDLSYKKIDRNLDLFIIRSPDYTKEWKEEFLKFYNLNSFNQL